MRIETERLILRNYKESDLQDYWEYVSQANVGPRCGWPAYTEKEKAAERLKYETTKPFQFAIELKDSHKVIGSIELMETRDTMLEKLQCKPEETREIGCLLNENFWGKGIMTEAMKAIVKYGFDNMGLKVITAGYYEPNAGSGKVQMKCGMRPYQRLKDKIVWYETGKPVDAIDCKITREEYEQIEEYKSLEIKVEYNSKEMS